MDKQTGNFVRQLETWADGIGSGRVPLRFPQTTQDLRGPAAGHFHLRSELFLQISGACEFRFPTETLVLGPDQALIVPPRVPHAETIVPIAEAEFNNLVLIIDGTTLSLHSAVEGHALCPRVEFPLHQNHVEYLKIGAWLEDATTAGTTDRIPAVAAHLCAASLARCAKLVALESAPTQREPNLVAMVRSVIRNRLGDAELSVASLAEQLVCSPDYLSHLFATSTGLHLVEWINELRLSRAAELLVHTNLSSKETAWACGFANHSYFIRLFRQRYCASPLEYRLRLR